MGLYRILNRIKVELYEFLLYILNYKMIYDFLEEIFDEVWMRNLSGSFLYYICVSISSRFPLRSWILSRMEEKGLNSFTFPNLCPTIISVTLPPLPVEKSVVLGCQSRAVVRSGEALGRWPLAKPHTCGGVINGRALSTCLRRPWRSAVTGNICSLIHFI